LIAALVLIAIGAAFILLLALTLLLLILRLLPVALLIAVAVAFVFVGHVIHSLIGATSGAVAWEKMDGGSMRSALAGRATGKRDIAKTKQPGAMPALGNRATAP
jgi:small-conductance mechanosensitive channel